MKKIIIIARTELSNLFYSPIAWLLLIIFTVQCGLSFTDAVHDFMMKLQVAKLYPQLAPSQATGIMSDSSDNSVFSMMVGKLYLYLPLLTMGLISRETSSGTIRLLYSSPVKTSQIVLGKFLAMVICNLLLLLPLAILSVVAVWNIPHADTGLLLSGLLAIFLLLCTYAAIGLFLSCLTSHQVVAALCTVAVFAAMQYIGQLWQGIDFVRDLTYYLSVGSRIQGMFDGLITSRDVLYFITIIILFLCLSMLRLKANQESIPLWASISRYAGLSITAIVIIFLTSRPSLTAYLDVTEPQLSTVAPTTQALLKSTGKEPLVLTAYVNLMDYNYATCSPQSRHSYLAVWEKYLRFKPAMSFRYVYYYDTTAQMAPLIQQAYKGKTVSQIAQDMAATYNVSIDRFLKPDEVRNVPGLNKEAKRLVMQMQYKGRMAYLRVFDDRRHWPDEEQVSAALKRLMKPEATPRIAFLEGSLERDPYGNGGRSYDWLTTAKLNRLALINNGYEIGTIQEGQDIPQGLTALVIADPKVALSSQTMIRLKRYIAEGGNLLITGEPEKQAILNPIIEQLGIQMSGGTLVQQDKGETSDILMPGLTATAADMSQGTSSLYNSHQPVFMPGAAALNYTNGSAGPGSFTTRPLLELNAENNWLKMGKFVRDSVAVAFNAKGGDQHGNFSPALALTRMVSGRQQRIVVTGDADFMSNQAMTLHTRNNAPFGLALFKWFSNGVFPVDISKAQPKDNTVNTTNELLSELKMIFVWVIPGILLMAGAMLLIRRKRK